MASSTNADSRASALARRAEEEAKRLSELKTLFDPKTLVRKGTSSTIHATTCQNLGCALAREAR